jgi:hypothetical protein
MQKEKRQKKTGIRGQGTGSAQRGIGEHRTNDQKLGEGNRVAKCKIF